MEIKKQTITPKLAKEILDRSPNNPRGKTQEWHVREYVDKINAGKFRLSPHGIVINTEGELVDGFHRLNAIEQAGVAVEMYVATGVETQVVEVIDRGLKRPDYVVLGMGKFDSEIVSLAARLGTAEKRVSEDTLKEYGKAMAPFLEEFNRRCTVSYRNVTTPAPVRLGVLLNMYRCRDSEAVTDRYNNVRFMQFDGDPAALAVYKALVRFRKRGGDEKIDRLKVAWLGFNTDDQPRVLVRAGDADWDEIKETIRMFGPGNPSAAK